MIYFLVKDLKGINRAVPLTTTLAIYSGFQTTGYDEETKEELIKEFSDIGSKIYKDEEMTTLDKYPVSLSIQEIFSRVSQANEKGMLLVDLTKNSGMAAFRHKAETHRFTKKLEREFT